MNILVLGASGQLGQCIKKVAGERGVAGLDFPDEGAGNILDKDGLRILFADKKPDFVINCAAYTAVDKAEDDVELCRAINRDGALNVAGACAAVGACLVHVSTDFVFKGDRMELLKEEDAAEPVSVYGLTKLEGEQAIADTLDTYFIVRTSWLYSEYANNFVKTMLKLGADKEELNIIADQIGTPTYAIDLAGAILDMIASGSTEYGLYHYSNEGAISWFDFARAIFDISNTVVKVNPIGTDQYPTRAERPRFSVMDKTRIRKAFGIDVPYWRDSLLVCLDRLVPRV